jgi:hypothetical protein
MPGKDFGQAAGLKWLEASAGRGPLHQAARARGCGPISAGSSRERSGRSRLPLGATWRWPPRLRSRTPAALSALVNSFTGRSEAAVVIALWRAVEHGDQGACRTESVCAKSEKSCGSTSSAVASNERSRGRVRSAPLPAIRVRPSRSRCVVVPFRLSSETEPPHTVWTFTYLKLFERIEHANAMLAG